MGISIVSAMGVGFAAALVIGLLLYASFGHWRMRYFGGKQEDGGWSSCGSQEFCWKWLAIREAKKLMKESETIGYVYVEDISDKFWDDQFTMGKVVWEQKK